MKPDNSSPVRSSRKRCDLSHGDDRIEHANAPAPRQSSKRIPNDLLKNLMTRFSAACGHAAEVPTNIDSRVRAQGKFENNALFCRTTPPISFQPLSVLVFYRVLFLSTARKLPVEVGPSLQRSSMPSSSRDEFRTKDFRASRENPHRLKRCSPLKTKFSTIAEGVPLAG